MTVLSFVAQQLLQSRLHQQQQQQQQLYGALLAAAAAAAAAQRAMMVRRQETTATTSSPSAPVPHDGPRAKKTASIWSPATDIENNNNNNNNNRTGYNDNSGNDETIAWTSDQTKMRYGHRPTRPPIPSGTGNLNEYRPDAGPAPVLPSGDSL